MSLMLRSSDNLRPHHDLKKSVVLSTIHSAKALVYLYVIRAGLERDGEDIEATRKLAYVGMTRAMDCLTVICCDNSPLAKDLRKAVR